MINPDTTAKELEELAKKNNPKICQQIARHPNTPPKLLKELFNRYFLEVLENPVLELILLENPTFLSDLDDVINYECFEREQLPLFCYEIAINYPHIWFRQAIALNPNTPIHILEKLALDKNIEVRVAVGLNENTSIHQLKKLALDKHHKVIDFIEATSDISEHYFDFCDLPSFYYEIAVNHNDDNDYVWFCKQIAINNHTPPHILEKLSLNKDSEIRAEVALNHNTPIHILEKLALDKSQEVLSSIACNENISKEIIKQLAKEQKYYVMLGLAGNPKTPHKLLQLLAENESHEIRSTVAGNPNTPNYILEFLAEDADREIGWHIGNNPNTSSKTLEKLSQHKDYVVRRIISHRKHISIKIIEDLAKDNNE